jgi:hypothetical protein
MKTSDKQVIHIQEQTKDKSGDILVITKNDFCSFYLKRSLKFHIIQISIKRNLNYQRMTSKWAECIHIKLSTKLLLLIKNLTFLLSSFQRQLVRNYKILT